MTEISSDNKSPLILTDSKTVFIDIDRNTKLHLAAASGDTEEVLKEIQNGHKTDITNYLGWTPLMMAARHGHFEIVKVLLEKLADSTRRNKFGCSIFHMAIASGKLDLVVFILQHLLRGGVTRKSMEGFLSPISLAILFNHKPIVQSLIDQTFNINSETIKTEITPIMFAAATGNIEMFNYLTSRGADTDPNTVGAKLSEIFKMKHFDDCPANQANQQNQVPSPILIIHPPIQTVMNHPPQYVTASLPTHNLYPPMMGLSRKSSDFESPCFMSPDMSPVTPTFRPAYLPGYATQQVFFPPEFSPGNFISPYQNVSHNSDLLNRRLHQTTFLYTFPQFSPVNNQY